MQTNKLQIFLIAAISLFVGYNIGLYKVTTDWKTYSPHIQIINKEPPSSVATVDLAQFWNVWEKVSTLYYDKKVVDPQKMINGAIIGLVGALGDPYTMYLPPVQNNNFQQELAGKFEGIGAELGTKDKEIIVIAPLSGSPAQKAGVMAGDIIYKVNGVIVEGLALPQVVDKIRGPKGTKVTITLLHKNDKQTTDVEITRDTITVKSVDGWVKDVSSIDAISDEIKTKDKGQKVAYMRLSQFGDGTNQDWSALIAKLSNSIDSSTKGMILDLRNNPGGYLTDATFIAGEFLPENTLVVKEDNGNGDVQQLLVTRKGSLLNIPLVVLLNGGSASASEIVAGALRDYGRATLVGEQSFGKGTVQQALDLGGGAGLHVTVAKWLTPKDTWVHGKGLTPDIKISIDTKDVSHDVQLEGAIKYLIDNKK